MSETTQIKIERQNDQKNRQFTIKSKFLNDTEEIDIHPQIRNAQRRKPKVINEPIRLVPPEAQKVHVQPYVPKPDQIPEAIKQIDRKIKEYKKIMEKEMKEKFMREQMELIRQNEWNNENDEEQKKAYDYLTNPQIQTIQEDKQPTPNQEPMESPQHDTIEPIEKSIQHQQVHSYSEAAQKRERIYEKTITRMYERRQNPALFAKLRRKTPILNITTKNKVQKGNGRIDPEEHKLRVYNRENVPMIPELVIPSFQVKKDSQAQNILAYLKEYTPLYRGYKNFEYPKCVKNILQDEIDSIQKV